MNIYNAVPQKIMSSIITNKIICYYIVQDISIAENKTSR